MVNLDAPVGYFGNPLLDTNHLIDFSYLDCSNNNNNHNYNAASASTVTASSPAIFSSLAATSMNSSSSSVNFCWTNSYKSVHSTTSSSSNSSSGESVVLFELLKLPPEIIEKVTHELDQNDCLSLLLSCSYMYNIVKPRIWSYIIVDANYSEFNKEMINMAQQNDKQLSPTFIKTSFRIRSLFNNLNEENSREIKRIFFINIPQDFLNYELKNLINDGLFSKLVNLNQVAINLKLTSFPINRIVQNFNADQITSLSLSLDLAQSDLQQYTIPDLPLGDFKHLFAFPRLQYLSLSLNFDNNHHNSLILYYIFKSLIVSGNTLSSFKTLEIYNNSNLFNSDSTLSNILINDSPRVSNDNNNLIDVHILTNLFKPMLEAQIKMQKLTKLTFYGFLVIPSQAFLLLNCIDLTTLRILKLEKISEFQLTDFDTSGNNFFTQNRDLLISQLKPGFLDILSRQEKFAKKPTIKANKLINLQTLVIDYKECLKDSVISFISNLPRHGKLQHLNVTIRWNMKQARIITSLNEYIGNFLHTLSHSFHNLAALSVDLKREIKPGFNTTMIATDRNELINQDHFQHNLKLFKRLQSLRFFCHALNNSFIQFLMNAKSNNNQNNNNNNNNALTLNRLQYMDIFGPGAGGRPNMALQVAHAGIFDNWFKVQHIAIQLAKNNNNLKFIRINDCLFEVKRLFSNSTLATLSSTFPISLSSYSSASSLVVSDIEVMPREGTNEWFDDIVKSEYRFFNV